MIVTVKKKQIKILSNISHRIKDKKRDCFQLIKTETGMTIVEYLPSASFLLIPTSSFDDVNLYQFLLLISASSRIFCDE